jgi:PEP-CTERM motif
MKFKMLAIATVALTGAFASAPANAVLTCPPCGPGTTFNGGLDTNGPQFLISMTGPNVFTVSAINGNQGPYEGADDTYVAVINNSSSTINSVSLFSPNAANGGIFGFDGDGVNSFIGQAANNASDNTGYGGPLSFYTGISANHQSGTVNFIGGLAPGAFTYFSLEEALTLSQIQPGVPEPATWGMMILGFISIGLMGYRRSRKASGALAA